MTRFSMLAGVAVFSLFIATIPGVERTLAPIVPPTSVSSLPSTTKSSVRSIPGSRATRPSPARRKRRASRP